MKKSIFQKEMQDSKFRAIYEDVARKLNIGEKIAELRHKKHMTQEQLAKKVHTSRTAIARYESGIYIKYNLQTLARIATALGADLKISLAAH